MSDETVVINKSTYNKLLGAVVVLLIAFSFVGGYVLGGAGKVTTTAAVVAPTAPSVQAPPAKVDVKYDTAYLLGSKDAKVKIVEFSDFQCPFCGRFFTQSYGQIKTEYIDTGKVAFYFRHFPLSFHVNAAKAAEAAECAGEQGKFWDYHDVLFQKQSVWSDTDGITAFKQYATDLKLDTVKFNSCLDSGKYANKVNTDISEGSSYGVSGTPTLYINGNEIVGAQPYSVFKQAIDAELAK